MQARPTLSLSVPLLSRIFKRTARGQMAAGASLSCLSRREVQLLRVFNGFTPTNTLATLLPMKDSDVAEAVIRLLAMGLIEAASP